MEDVMRLVSLSRAASASALALAAAACGADPASDANAPAARTLEGDAALIAAAQKVSDTIGGCTKPEGETIESKVIGLESGTIVMLGCSKGEFDNTVRLFSARANETPVLISIPDFGVGGWYATDQANMAELDAGTGILTTSRRGVKGGTCGSEGSYKWDGKRFSVQEMHWQSCDDPDAKGPPFPIIWPTQQNLVVDPNGATPAP
jgi:hypothetical protein